ncbi:MAG: hypothetical protein E7430_00600 [Ruminococcaceae bacterium]|nr:hypothetical protein [Oscillospiraceae bacterium]
MTRNQLFKDELPYLLFLVAMFACGCALGRFVSLNLSGSGLAAAQEVADGLLNGNIELTTFERLLNSLSTVGKFPILVFLLSMSSFGKLITGPVFAVQGFLMTFFTGCISTVTGRTALVASFCVLLPSCIFSLPCMLLLAKSGHRGSGRINNGKSSVRYLLLLVPAVFADMYLCPVLLRIFYS